MNKRLKPSRDSQSSLHRFCQLCLSHLSVPYGTFKISYSQRPLLYSSISNNCSIKMQSCLLKNKFAGILSAGSFHITFLGQELPFFFFFFAKGSLTIKKI